MADTTTTPQDFLDKLKTLRDMEIGGMPLDEARQMLMTARELGIIPLTNDQIAGLCDLDTRVKLNEAKRTAIAEF